MTTREKYIEILRKILNYDFFKALTDEAVLSYDERLAIHKEIANNSDELNQGEIPVKAIAVLAQLENYTTLYTTYKENETTTIIEAFYIQNETITAHEKFKK